ncbi:MAG: hypothetical protein JW881_15375 [Spirochaetales bacterium]|nr:hypothetical protein [Spirochaetales bacterium]
MEDIGFITSPFGRMITGHILFIFSGVFYSIHWVLNYYRNTDEPHIPSQLFIIVSLLLGIAGAVLLAYTLFTIANQITGQFKIQHIVLISIAFFIISLLITSIVFHRRFTSEIFFIVLWAGIEAGCIYAFYRLGWFSLPQFTVSLICAFICLAAGMVCYTIHYKLPARQQFINGLIPYIVISFSMLITTVMLFVNKITGALRM